MKYHWLHAAFMAGFLLCVSEALRRRKTLAVVALESLERGFNLAEAVLTKSESEDGTGPNGGGPVSHVGVGGLSSGRRFGR